ncbi:Kazal-like serine protease inhibitor domain-containing protein [Phytophthora sojae]|uniref:Kazal-like serine protease inhibitor domain-containing protein n=1 Tax=Phytophthora sojae (strain P6497) TaxID=1094619 RepID=G4ZZ13_PHYSP|nr:Kazal-like serine protease inhibitor domain-containing protein [Phytophthora sojae]EGZ12196.1 Kazal-like serine protease inhibitor domain-containing protein [Phytophthora sojae]|eukprot:XP_009532529.1 Kazal-like serine protease inhibitor domain-containing protein [Phytophthora sojae]
MKFAAVAVLASLMFAGATAAGSVGCGPEQCSTKRDAVCGSNGVTYRNMCEFNNHNCDNGLQWTAKPGNCPRYHRTDRE